MKTIPNDIFFSQVIDLLEQGEKVKITVQGTSMKPFFQSGKDQVILSSVRDNTKRSRHTSLRRGDVILFQYRDRFILHRICHIHGTLIIARGDNCYGNCEKITTADVYALAESGTCFGQHFHFHAKGKIWCSAAWFWRHTYKFRKSLLKLKHLLQFRKK